MALGISWISFTVSWSLLWNLTLIRASFFIIIRGKSIFGSIKNYFTTPPAGPSTGGSKNPPSSGSSQNEGSQKNATASKGLTSILESPSSSSAAADYHPGLRSRGYGEDQNVNSFDAQLDDHLGEMSAGLSRLKGLAKGLGDEIEDQNSMLDRMATRTEGLDWKVKKQNKEMNKILKR